MSGGHKLPMIFKIYRGDELVREERLAQDIIKVGKLASSHLRIDDEHVSRMHAVIEVSGADEVHIVDLGSATGTIVNGKKVNKAKLESGDEVRLGDTRVVIEFEAAATAASVPAPAPVVAPGLPVPPGIRRSSAAPAMPVPPIARSLSQPAGLAAAGAHGHDDGDEDPETVQYGIVASGPPVSPDEVETGEQAVEVVIMWGDRSVLHVEHLSPPRTFWVGEAGVDKKTAGVDFLISEETLGTARMPIVIPSGAGAAILVPPGATGDVLVGNQRSTLAELQASGRLQPSSEMPGAMQFALPQGSTARVQYKGFTFMARPVAAGKKVAGAASVDRRPLVFVGGSLLLHGLFLVLFYFAPPRPASLSLDLLNADSRLVKYLSEPPETEEEEVPDFLEENKQNEDEGGKGKRHKGEEGQMGKKEAQKTKNKFGIEGPEDNQDPHMAREAALEQAKTAGILGILRASQGAFNSPTSPFGRDTALGNDPMSALGALMGDQIGENFGFGGLGLRGTGRGGGGTGEGTIGLGNIGTIGHGAGGGTGSGYGRGAGGFSGRSARVPTIRQGTADVRGSLSKEVIRRVIRRHINEVRHCYEQELNAQPDLEGRVTVSFIISPTGAVQTSSVADTTMNNSRVEGCISQAVRRWTFPAPDGGGIVVVNYPFQLAASGGGE